MNSLRKHVVHTIEHFGSANLQKKIHIPQDFMEKVLFPHSQAQNADYTINFHWEFGRVSKYQGARGIGPLRLESVV